RSPGRLLPEPSRRTRPPQSARRGRQRSNLVLPARSWRYLRRARKAQIAGPDLLAPQERSFAVSCLERNPSIVAGTGNMHEAELTFHGECSRDDVRIGAIRLVEPCGRSRGQRTRRELVERIRARAVDFQKLAEMAVAGEKDDAFDALAHKPVGERRSLRGEVLPSFETRRAVPELAAAGDNLDRGAWSGNERLLQPFELARAEHRLVRPLGPAVGRAKVAIVEQ